MHILSLEPLTYIHGGRMVPCTRQTKRKVDFYPPFHYQRAFLQNKRKAKLLLPFFTPPPPPSRLHQAECKKGLYMESRGPGSKSQLCYLLSTLNKCLDFNFFICKMRLKQVTSKVDHLLHNS